MDGPTICEYQDQKTPLQGYTDGNTRAESRANALSACQMARGNTTGIQYLVVACVGPFLARVSRPYFAVQDPLIVLSSVLARQGLLIQESTSHTYRLEVPQP